MYSRSAYHLHGIFRWEFWDKWKFIYSGKNGSKYDAVPFVKNDPVELSRLGRLVPRFAKSSATVGERMTWVRFLQMVVQLIPVILVETKNEVIFSKAFLLFQKSFTGLNCSIWHFIRKKVFWVQMVSAWVKSWQPNVQLDSLAHKWTSFFSCPVNGWFSHKRWKLSQLVRNAFVLRAMLRSEPIRFKNIWSAWILKWRNISPLSSKGSLLVASC